MAKVGRPSIFTKELEDEICGLIADGNSLTSITKREDMPCTVTVYKELRINEEFANRYTRAREDQADTLADQIIDIADETRLDKNIDDNGNEVTDNEAIQRSRLRVEARKWVAAKLKPKKYGDKVDLNVSVRPQVSVIDLSGEHESD